MDNEKLKAAVEQEGYTVKGITGAAAAPAEQTRTMEITGMMCGHCEAHVKEALEAIEGVKSAEASHTAGTAVLTLTQDVDNTKLKAAVEEQGYKVRSIR